MGIDERRKRLADYGVPEDKSEWLYQKCLDLTGEEYELLRETAFSICPDRIAHDIFLSLTGGASYYVLRVIGRAKISKNDFYAYRRKTIAEFYHRLEGDKT